MPSSSAAAGGGNGRPSARVRTAAVAALLATFAAGVAAGVGVEQWRHHRTSNRGDRHGAGGPLARLNLSPEQKARVDSILARRRVELEKFWAGPGQQLRLVVDSTRNEVRAVLTPSQRASYDSLMAARRARGAEHGGAERGDGGPPIDRPPPPGRGPD